MPTVYLAMAADGSASAITSGDGESLFAIVWGNFSVEYTRAASDKEFVETTERLELSWVEGDGLLSPILTGLLVEQPAPAFEGIILGQLDGQTFLSSELNRNFPREEGDSNESDKLDASAKRQIRQQQGVGMLVRVRDTVHRT